MLQMRAKQGRFRPLGRMAFRRWRHKKMTAAVRVIVHPDIAVANAAAQLGLCRQSCFLNLCRHAFLRLTVTVVFDKLCLRIHASTFSGFCGIHCVKSHV